MKINEIINMGLLIATVFLAAMAFIQLKAMRKQANADFILRFNNDFFGKEINQKIIVAIEENKNLLKENVGEFTDYQLDDYLGYFELMSLYEEKGILEFEYIDETFGDYIALAWQNKEINEYITGLRNERKDQRYYKRFEGLAIKVIAKEKEIRNKR